MSDGYSPEYLADKKLEQRIRQAQRARVWTATYAAVAGAVMRTANSSSAQYMAREEADKAVLQFDEAWRPS